MILSINTISKVQLVTVEVLNVQPVRDQSHGTKEFLSFNSNCLFHQVARSLSDTKSESIDYSRSSCVEHVLSEISERSPDDYVEKLTRILNNIHLYVRSRVKINSDRMKVRFDVRVKFAGFKEGGSTIPYVEKDSTSKYINLRRGHTLLSLGSTTWSTKIKRTLGQRRKWCTWTE